jgi:hypothetical protein
LHAVCLDGSDVNPEAGVVRLVLGVRVDLALDPLNRLAIELDIFGVGVAQAGSTVTMTSKPLVITIIILAVPSAGHIGIDIGAMSLLDGKAQAPAS